MAHTFYNHCLHDAGSKFNPWKVNISYDTVAPWMGSNTRRSNPLLNTEHKKYVFTNQQINSKNVPSEVSHDEILSALMTADEVSTFYFL